MSDINSNNDLTQPKELFSGFFSNLNNISCMIFTIVPSLIAWYLSKDLKIMLIFLITCGSIAFFYTINKNAKFNKTLIRSIQYELDEFKDKIDKSNELLVEKDKKIIKLTNDLNELRINRESILINFNEYKNYKDAYNSAKHGVFVLSNMQKDKSIKSSVEILFKNIEEELNERNEDSERYI